jgi:hypothetical protein
MIMGEILSRVVEKLVEQGNDVDGGRRGSQPQPEQSSIE